MVAARRYHFNRYGSYIGFVDEDGRYYLCDGTYRGCLTAAGVMLDPSGRRRGHVDVQGQYWDEEGVFRGYLRGPTGSHVPPAPAIPAPPGKTRGPAARRKSAHA